MTTPPITRCPPGEGFGGQEPRLDPVALDLAGHWIEALYHATLASRGSAATAIECNLRYCAIAALRVALRCMLGPQHAEMRGAYDKLVAFRLTPEEMHHVAGRLFTLAECERQNWGAGPRRSEEENADG